MKSIKQQLLDAKLFGADKLEIQRLQQLLDEEEAYRIDEIFDEESDSEFQIKEVTNQLQQLLIKKNRAYGNSALEPLNIFSQQNAVDSLCARLDDKLSRIKNKGLNDKTEDTLFDLAGYLILLIIAKMSKIKTATEQHVEWLEKKYWTLRDDGHFGIALHMLDAIEHAKEMSKLEKKTIYEAVRDAVDGCDEYYKKEKNEQD